MNSSKPSRTPLHIARHSSSKATNGGHGDSKAGRGINICGRELSKAKKAIETHDSGMASVEVGDRQGKVESEFPIFDYSSGLI